MTHYLFNMNHQVLFDNNIALAGACIGMVIGFALGIMCGLVIARMAQEFGSKIKLRK